jgi:hypothetical protein
VATTLANLRAKLNGEIGVTTDGETAPWSTTVRNNAISDGYAELWRVGVWKDAKQDLVSVADQAIYALTSIRRQRRIELLDSSSRLLELPPGIVMEDGSGGYHLALRAAPPGGYTIRLYGWTAYTSTFASDAAVDDLAAEYNRIPLLKAKAILWRAQLAKAARYAQRQAGPPEMSLTIDQLIGMIAAAEREFRDEAEALSGLRTRSSQTIKL